jgi:hypothetical protein
MIARNHKHDHKGPDGVDRDKRDIHRCKIKAKRESMLNHSGNKGTVAC